ncbi:MAG: ABC transporter permease [Jatrophihabitans sp.]
MTAVDAVIRRGGPDLLTACLQRFRVEFTEFWRSREGVFFTVLFPPVMLILFGAIFGSGDVGQKGSGVTFPQYFTAGMIGTGIWGSCFQNLAISVPLERDNGALKRLYGTPLPKVAYFVGKVLLVAVLSIIEIVVLLALGRAFFHVPIPPADRLLTLAWVFGLGVTACTLLGLAVAGLIRNGRSAAAVVSPIAILIQFISGVYFVYGELPPWLRAVGSVFPLRWMTLGLRSVFLPDSFAASEPGHSWQHPMTALVLGIWCVAGLLVTLRTFRWMSERER